MGGVGGGKGGGRGLGEDELIGGTDDEMMDSLGNEKSKRLPASHGKREYKGDSLTNVKIFGTIVLFVRISFRNQMAATTTVVFIKPISPSFEGGLQSGALCEAESRISNLYS